MNKGPLSPKDMENYMLEIKSDLERICATLAHWRLYGYNGTKEVPIKLLPIEAQALKVSAETKKLIEYIRNLP